jgi:hypothetical protein
MMKPISKNNSQNNKNRDEKQPNPLILALVLTGILALEMYPALRDTAAANAGALKYSLAQLESQQQQNRAAIFLSGGTPKNQLFGICTQ